MPTLLPDPLQVSIFHPGLDHEVSLCLPPEDAMRVPSQLVPDLSHYPPLASGPSTVMMVATTVHSDADRIALETTEDDLDEARAQLKAVQIQLEAAQAQRDLYLSKGESLCNIVGGVMMSNTRLQQVARKVIDVALEYPKGSPGPRRFYQTALTELDQIQRNTLDGKPLTVEDVTAFLALPRGADGCVLCQGREVWYPNPETMSSALRGVVRYVIEDLAHLNTKHAWQVTIHPSRCFGSEETCLASLAAAKEALNVKQ
jgi:hypothetical protein